MERREAPRRFARPPTAGCYEPGHTPSFRDPSAWREWGSRGARALARSPGASRRSIAARVVGGRTLLGFGAPL